MVALWWVVQLETEWVLVLVTHKQENKMRVINHDGSDKWCRHRVYLLTMNTEKTVN